ncbi:MAG: TlpA disulfide reductase family protein [Pseudomonadota bacterium]
MLSGAMGFAFQHWLTAKNTGSPASVDSALSTGDPLPSFVFSDLNGAPQSSDKWRGKIRVINFWASWCPPCVRELPALERFAHRFDDQGVVVVAVAYDDVENVLEFMSSTGIKLPVLHGDIEVYDLMRLLGNTSGALPFTVLADSQGVIIDSIIGELEEEELEPWVSPLLTN